MKVNNKLKILVIVESIDVDDSSSSKGRVAFIESFRKAGYEVTVLHYSQKEIELFGVDCVAVKEKKSTVNYFLSRLQRLSYRWFQLDISKYVNTLFGFSFGFFNDVYSISTALKKQNPDDFDMLWTFGKGTSFRVHAAVLKNPNWFPLWYAFVHDPYPQDLYPRPYNFVEYGFKQKRNFFREITINAYRMVFPSLLLKEWMQSYFVHIEGKSLIIPHQLSTAINKENKLPSYFNTTKFNVLHAGNLLDLRDPKPLVEAFEKLISEVSEAKELTTLLFLGKKSIYHEYLLQKKQQIPQLYISDDYVKFEEVYSIQQKASINIILEAKSEISPFLPGKFPHCVAANKPIFLIGPYYSECKRLLGKEYLYSFDFDQVDEMAKAFKELFQFWNISNEGLKLNRPDLEQYLSSDYLKKVLEVDHNNSKL